MRVVVQVSAVGFGKVGVGQSGLCRAAVAIGARERVPHCDGNDDIVDDDNNEERTMAAMIQSLSV